MAYSLITHVEAGLGSGGGTTSAIDTTGASFLVLSVGWYGAGGAPTISDSKGNTWTALTLRISGITANQLYYCANPTVGSGHTFTATAGLTYCAVCVLAFSGSHATPFGNESGTTASATTIQAGSLTPTEGNCLVIAGVSPTDGSGNISIDGGFTEYDVPWASGVNEGCGIGYLIQTSAAAANPTWTMDASSAVSASLAWFKAAAGGSSYNVDASESASSSETESAIASFAVSRTEAASASETSSNIATLVAASTEAASASESNSSTYVTASAASESASSSETSTGTAAYPCSGSEAASGSESSSCTLTAVASATEAASASETSLATIVTAASVSESASASDTCSSTPATSGSCTEAAGASETSSAVLITAASSTEAASASDSASCIASFAGAVVETATASDSLNVVVTFASSASESASASETWTSIDAGAEGSDFVIYCSLETDHEFTASLLRDHTFDVPL